MSPPGGQEQLPTTLDDFRLKGTQPNSNDEELEVFYAHFPCMSCHGDYDLEVSPMDTWGVSLMAHSARDPVFQAALTIANQDANVGGNFCLRCHAPSQFYRQGAETGELNIFNDEDMDGVACTVCHRMVNPIYGKDSAEGYPGNPQDPDLPIISDLANQGLLPESPGNAQLVLDPVDVRRGPYSDVPANLHGINQSGSAVRIITSPYHGLSQMCGSCHDVGSALFRKGSDGKFHLNEPGSGNPTTDVLQTTPEQRTFSEWLHSDFAAEGVVFEDGRFGGHLPDAPPIRPCQNCHMPPHPGGACELYESPPFFERDDIGVHAFAGANTWVLAAIRSQLGDGKADYYGITEERLEAATARTLQMLQDASDMELSQSGSQLNVRIINQSGHKLPTGYPEGRRMWVNVRFFDRGGALVDEYGAYDYETATLSTTDTKVYEKKMGISPEVAAVVNLPPGESFHLSLNNYVVKDNCIPPRGFTNANFALFDGQPVAYSYEDGAFFDDTLFQVPAAAHLAVATLYYQTSSREYIEFLRDTNETDDRGETIHELWTEQGKSAPVAMDSMEIQLRPGNPADLNGDGLVNGADLGLLLIAWGSPGPAGDLNNDGIVNGADLGLFLVGWAP